MLVLTSASLTRLEFVCDSDDDVAYEHAVNDEACDGDDGEY